MRLKSLLILFALCPVFMSGQSPASASHWDEGDLWEYAQFIKISDKTLGLASVRSDSFADQWEAVPQELWNIGFTSDQYWVRFSLENASEKRQTFFLETARPITDRVNLYTFENENLINTQRSGDQIPFKDRALPYRASLFKVELPPRSSRHFYLELGSDGEVISLPLQLARPDHFIEKTSQSTLFFGLFYGVLLLAAVIYLFFYFGLRDSSFLNYGLYVLSILALQLSLDGYLFQYFFTDGGYLNGRMVMISALLSIFFLGRYSETFLRLNERLSWIGWGFKAVYLFTGVLFLGMLFSDTWLEYSYPLSNQTGLVLLLLILTSIVALRIKKQRVDPFYVAGIAFLLAGLVIFILNNLSVLPNNFITLNSSKIGSGLEVVFLSISMSNLIRQLKSEKEAMQAEALRKSEEMNDIKSYFMSNMSHELRTPLNAIMGLAQQMMNEDSSKEERLVNLEVIKHSSLSLLSSVNDILDFSKIEKGQLKLKERPMDPKSGLDEISRNWQRRAEEKGLAYALKVDPGIPDRISGDQDRLEQIGNNLLSNAVKFTHEGSVKAHLWSEKTSDDQIDLIFEVEDTGVGIPKNRQKRIFESFLQENVNDKRKFGGIGLGLTIVKKLVDLKGGKLELESKPGQGSRFRVSLPHQVLSAPREKSIAPVANYDLGGARILMAEDNSLNQMVMRKLISKWENTELDIVENGQEALEKLAEKHYDLILMDLQMPVMDGYEASQRIRQGQVKKLDRHIPIIAVTADTMAETEEKVFQIGLDAYVTKPVKADQLFQHCKKLLKEDDLSTEAAS